MVDDSCTFECPHCGVELIVVLDVSGGQKQSFIQDCEVCCKPIQISVRFSGEEVIDFSASSTD